MISHVKKTGKGGGRPHIKKIPIRKRIVKIFPWLFFACNLKNAAHFQPHIEMKGLYAD
jgi:hypothetical protein